MPALTAVRLPSVGVASGHGLALLLALERVVLDVVVALRIDVVVIRPIQAPSRSSARTTGRRWRRRRRRRRRARARGTRAALRSAVVNQTAERALQPALTAVRLPSV